MVRARRILAITGLAALLGCSPQTPAGVPPAPASPEATVGQFMAAVNANDLTRMGALFGDERGPLATYRPSLTEREQRMAIIQHLLKTDSTRILGWEPVPGFATRRRLQFELKHGDQWIAAPLTVAQQRSGGWLVQEIKIDALLPGGGQRTNP